MKVLQSRKKRRRVLAAINLFSTQFEMATPNPGSLCLFYIILCGFDILSLNGGTYVTTLQTRVRSEGRQHQIPYTGYYNARNTSSEQYQPSKRPTQKPAPVFGDDKKCAVANRLPYCNETTRALDVLLDKMAGHLDKFAKEEHTNSTTALEELDAIRTRSSYFGMEVRTEEKNTCSAYLRSKLENLTYAINELEDGIKEKRRKAIVLTAVRNIFGGQNALARDFILSAGSQLEMDLILRDILFKILDDTTTGQQRDTNLNSVLFFISDAPKALLKTSTEIVVDILKRQNYIDNPFMMSLALVAKRGAGEDLKWKFPVAIQKIVWGRRVCLRNLQTNSFLLHEPLEFWRSRQNISQANDTNGNEEDVLEPSRLDVELRMPLSTIVYESCEWEFYPIMQSAEAPLFGARRKVSDDWIWNLNTANNSAYLSPFNENPELTLHILPKQNGTMISIQRVKFPSQNQTHGGYLCSTLVFTQFRRFEQLSLTDYYYPECLWTLARDAELRPTPSQRPLQRKRPKSVMQTTAEAPLTQVPIETPNREYNRRRLQRNLMLEKGIPVDPASHDFF